MKLSIITICYNAPNLEKTCESVISQKWQDFEWIVVDGGSNEITQKIWDKYKDRIDIFISEPDSGIYNAMNKGIRLAKGEYLLFLNAGDELYNEKALSYFANSTLTAPVIYGNCMHYNPSSKKSIKIVYPKKLNACFWIQDCICHQATFIKASLFQEFGLYSEAYCSASDFEKWLCFYSNKVKFQKLNHIIATFYWGGRSNTTGFTIADEERNNILRKYFSDNIIKKYASQRKTYKWHERLFSIKNSLDKKKKVITILNIHIYIPRLKKVDK